MNERIITFDCQNNVYIYNEHSKMKPVYPYKQHYTVGDAIIYLLELNKENIKIITK